MLEKSFGRILRDDGEELRQYQTIGTSGGKYLYVGVKK
jgi:hypothetical protein